MVMAMGIFVFRSIKFSIRHWLFTISTLSASLIAYGVGRLFEVSDLVQLIVGGSLLLTMFAVYLLTHTGYGAIYAWIGLHPITGKRTNIYVGLTTMKPYRDTQGKMHYPRPESHVWGSERYNEPPKPWSDTATDWHFVHESYHMFGVRKVHGRPGEAGPLLRLLEFINIRLRRPLYNDLMNRANPRRINEAESIAQRNSRDNDIMTSAYRHALTERLTGAVTNVK